MTRYLDVDGNTYKRPAHNAPIWRTSCYAVVRRGSCVLMTKPLDGSRWELPGGGVELGVDGSLVDAAVRECYEETGHTLVPAPGTLRFGGEILVRLRRAETYLNVLTFYVEGSVSGVQEPLWIANPTEAVSIAWIDPATLTIQDAIWYHLDALREMGVIAEHGGMRTA